MELLWLAIVFYSIGLGLVLHLKPALMFNENGTWKEFGYQREVGASRYTVFPFWLFAITWAFVSYTLAAAVAWNWSRSGAGIGAMAALAAARSQVSHIDEEYDETVAPDAELEEGEEELEAVPVSQTIRLPRRRNRPQTPARKPRPGYYVLDPASETAAGLRRYIYFGDNPPANGKSDGTVA